MPKLTETFAAKLACSADGTRKYWDPEVKGFGLWAGKRTKTWYFQRGQSRRVLIGRYPVISAAAPRQAAQTLALDMSRGAGKVFQSGAPTLARAMEAYLARPKLRSEAFKATVRSYVIAMARTLIEATGPARRLIADRGYDAMHLRHLLAERGTEAVIPSITSRRAPVPYDAEAYKPRKLVERMWCRLKDWRRIATRYDKLGRNFLAAARIAAAFTYWLN